MKKGLIFIEEIAKKAIALLSKEIDAEREKNGCLNLKSEIFLNALLGSKMQELAANERALFLAKFQINDLAKSINDPVLTQAVTDAVHEAIHPASSSDYSSAGNFYADTVQATIEATIRCLVKHARQP